MSTSTFTLTWTPGTGISSQYAKWRQKGTSTWNTFPYVTPSNPLLDTATTVDIGPLTDNWVYQFQIDSICVADPPIPPTSSTIYEGINFACVDPTVIITGNIVTVNYGSIGNIDSITAVIRKASDNSAVDTHSTSTMPFTFNSVPLANDTYYLDLVMYATVNGISVDSSATTCHSSNFTINA